MINSFHQNQTKALKIQIFKTNVQTKSELHVLEPLFNSNSHILKWTIDLEDIDKVLKVESHDNLSETDIINLLKSGGFYCEELI
jgi:hypothetical protein